jgi:hypothetical protein
MLRFGQSFFVPLSFGASIAVALSGGCGSKATGGLQGDGLGGGGGGGGDDAAGGVGSSGGSGGSGSSSGNTFGDDSGGAVGGSPGAPCPGCYLDTNCPGGGHTTISGTVFDPAGKNPLNNVVVFAPRDVTQLPAIPLGTNTCNTCDTPIGDYYAAVLSDYKGHFTLSGVPTGKNVPFVAQTGKWRYVFHVNTADCASTNVPNGVARLPRNHMEGDMPQMALLTGSADNLGCFLSGIGIAASEFTAPHAGGRLDIYQGLGNGAPGVSGGTAGNCTTNACPLWQSKASLEAYDIVLLACEGGEHRETKPASALTAMHDWLDAGGKVFATHYHYSWFEYGPPDFMGVATWGQTILDPAIGAGNYLINTSFSSGMTFDSWLGNVGALNSDGTITLTNVAASINTVNSPTLQWIYGPAPTGDSGIIDPTKYMSFGTPIGGIAVVDAGTESNKEYCGKAVLTDLHAGGGRPSGDLPTSCTTGTLSAQEMALEFLFFDLAACVHDETVPQTMPPPPK